MSDLVDGAVTEELLLALRLKPLDHRKLWQAVQAAAAMRATDAGAGAAVADGPGRSSYPGQQVGGGTRVLVLGFLTRNLISSALWAGSPSAILDGHQSTGRRITYSSIRFCWE